MGKNTKKIRCAAAISDALGQLLVIRRGNAYCLPSREIEYTQNTNECIEAVLRELQESCRIHSVQIDVSTGLLELDHEKSLLLVFGWVTEEPERILRAASDNSARPLWMTKRKEQQLVANLWNIYNHPTDLALSIALMQRDQLNVLAASEAGCSGVRSARLNNGETQPAALTYEQFMVLARENYRKGGNRYAECWDEHTFAYYVYENGPITKTSALEMFGRALVENGKNR